MFKLRTLFVIVGLFISFGSCFGAAAETCGVPPGRAQVSPVSESDFAEEASRRQDHLVKQDFTVTQIVTPGGPTHFEFLVARSDNVICLWFATVQGMVAIKLLGPDHQPPASWRGGRVEQQLERTLDPGKYVVDVQALDGARVYGLIGIRRWAVSPCNSDGNGAD